MLTREIFVKRATATMMAYNRYISLINRIEEVLDCSAAESFWEVRVIDEMIANLEAAMEDYDGWIEYFIGECFGDFDQMEVFLNDERFPIRGWEDVYDFLMEVKCR